MPQAPTTNPTPHWPAAALLGIGLLALAVRLPAMFHGLWYDEMYTLRMYIQQPWSHVVGGEYSPNNHVLFTLLAKLVTPVYRDPSVLQDDIDTVSILIRLPSLLAGSIAPIALAWPLRRHYARLSILIALLMALHPWLISSSAFARGYALLTLLAIISTNLLTSLLNSPQRTKWIHIPYAFCLAATVYTHPLGVGIAVGHAVAVLILRRDRFLTWFRSAAAAGLLTIALYSPFFATVGQYWSQPETPSVDYPGFLDAAIRHAHSGDAIAGIEHLLVPLLILLAGAAIAWRHEVLRILIVSFGAACVFGLLIPLLIPLAGEVRALHWLIPLYCLAAASIFINCPNPRWLAITLRIAFVLFVVVTSLRIYVISTIPAQPIREAARMPRQAGTIRIGLHMASNEALALYGGLDGFAYTLDQLRELEAQLPNQHIELVIFYEAFLQRQQPDLWRHVQANYTLARRLPGRIAPAAIYRRPPHLSNPPKS